jgi:hypothetical protein
LGAIYREVAAVNPDRYRTELITSLSNIAITANELGRPSEAAQARNEADRILPADSGRVGNRVLARDSEQNIHSGYAKRQGFFVLGRPQGLNVYPLTAGD